MLTKQPCETECARANEIGYGICKRCKKAVEVEVESPAERFARETAETEEFIKMAEQSRGAILERMKSLTPHYYLLVMGYVGDESMVRGIMPMTPIGRAQSIFLIAEAIGIMVPEEDRPWLHKPVEPAACEMGTCPLNFDRENTECAGCRHNQLRKEQ